MVEVTKLSELLEITNVKERDNIIRKQFAAYTPPIDVTDNETEALSILLNLTFKRGTIEDLSDFDVAKETLKNEEHIQKCLREVEWLHSHNLKYPDIRVSKQRLISEPLTAIDNVISSANCNYVLGWSHDSKTINLSKLFVSPFRWRGNTVCLARLLADENDLWAQIFKAHGITLKYYRKLCLAVKTSLPNSELPNSVDRYSIQMQFPYGNSYVAITPVTSHAIQSEIQQISSQKEGRFAYVAHSRPSSVSEFVSSVGGNIAVFNYPPRLNRNLKSFSELSREKVAAGEAVFNNKALSSTYFTKALDTLLYSFREITHKNRRRKKLNSYKRIRSGLVQWLRPIIEWRSEINANDEEIGSLNATSPLIHSLLTVEKKISEPTLSSLFVILNNHLVNKYAFHPDLIIPLRGLLAGIVNKLPNLSQHAGFEKEQQYCQRYLYIKNIQVFDAQALSNPYCLGIPSLTAVYGMTHNYQRRINEYLNTDIRLGSFAWYLRSYSAVSGTNLPEFTLQKSGSRSASFRRTGIIDTKLCDLTFDLVIKVYGDEEDLSLLTNEQDALMSAFPSKFAGGTMLPNVSASADCWCNLLESENELFAKLNKLPNFGQWVLPESRNIATLPELIETIKEDRHIAPVNLGFSFLEEPKARNNSLEKFHCYAEPLIGLVRYTDALDLKLSGIRHFMKKAFWQLDTHTYYLIINKAN
ncbi:type I-F CRISPR-associated protein Csy2 [Thalassotalea ganghwensis]